MILNARYGPVVDVLVIVRAHVQAGEEEAWAGEGSEKTNRPSAGEMEA